MYYQDIENGDCFILAKEEDCDVPNHAISDQLSLSTYLQRDLLERMVWVKQKIRPLEKERLKDPLFSKFIKSQNLHQLVDGIPVEIRLNDPLEVLAINLQERVLDYKAGERIVFLKPKLKSNELEEDTPRSLVSYSKNLFNSKIVDFEEIYNIQDYTVGEIVTSSSTLYFTLLPWSRDSIKMKQPSFARINISHWPNFPFFQRGRNKEEVKQEQGFNSEFIDPRRAYYELLRLSVPILDTLSNVIQIPKGEKQTAIELKVALCERFNETRKLIAKANEFSALKRMETGQPWAQFMDTFELCHPYQIIIVREAIWKDDYKVERDKILDRVVIKVYNDDELLFPDELKRGSITEATSSLRAILIYTSKPYMINFFKNREIEQSNQSSFLSPISQLDKQIDQAKLKLFFSRTILNQYFIQIKLVLQGRNTPLSDPFLLPLTDKSYSINSVLAKFVKTTKLQFKNKKGLIGFITSQDLLNNVTYQIKHYKLINEPYFTNSGWGSFERRQNFLFKLTGKTIRTRHPSDQRVIGKSVDLHKISNLVSGDDSVFTNFHQNRMLKHFFSPNPIVLEIVVPKDIYEAPISNSP